MQWRIIALRMALWWWIELFLFLIDFKVRLVILFSLLWIEPLESSSSAACCIAPFITTLACCSKTRMPIFNSMFQMALRRILVQTRRLLHGRKWSKSLSTGLLDYCITAQFLHRPLPRGNAYAVIKLPNPTFYLCSIHISCTELLRL